jgi:hypothetical protein
MHKLRWVLAMGFALALLVGCWWLLVRPSDTHSVIAEKLSSAPIANGTGRYFDSKKLVEVGYESDRFIALDIVRCVSTTESTYYAVMSCEIPGFTGFLGGVRYSESVDTVIAGTRPNEGLASRIQLPTSIEVKKVILFLREYEIGVGPAGDGKWRCFELVPPIPEKIVIPHVSKLPLAESSKEHAALIEKLDEVEKAVGQLRRQLEK